MPDIVFACKASTWAAETEELWVHRQPGLHHRTLSPSPPKNQTNKTKNQNLKKKRRQQIFLYLFYTTCIFSSRHFSPVVYYLISLLLGGAEAWTQYPTYGRQEFYHWAISVPHI